MEKYIKLPGFSTDFKMFDKKENYSSQLYSKANNDDSVVMQRVKLPSIMRGNNLSIGVSTPDNLCDIACACCALPSPITPECCGACLACNFCDITGWC